MNDFVALSLPGFQRQFFTFANLPNETSFSAAASKDVIYLELTQKSERGWVPLLLSLKHYLVNYISI